MQMDVRFRVGLADINVEQQYQAPLEDLWKDETVRGQIVQLALQALKEYGFAPDEIGWISNEHGYTLAILVSDGLKVLTQQIIKTEIVPKIKEMAKKQT